MRTWTTPSASWNTKSSRRSRRRPAPGRGSPTAPAGRPTPPAPAELPRRGDEESRGEVTHHLATAHPPVASSEAAEPTRAHRLAKVAEGDVPAPVASRGPAPARRSGRAPPRPAGRSYGCRGTETRVGRDRRGRGRGVVVPAQHEVVAAERDDPRLGRRAAERRQPVGVHAAADDDPLRIDSAALVATVVVPPRRERPRLAPEQDLAAARSRRRHTPRPPVRSPRRQSPASGAPARRQRAARARSRLGPISSAPGTPFSTDRR